MRLGWVVSSIRDELADLVVIFKPSALWADAFYKSVCLSVCLSLCVCVHFLRYRLNVFLPPLPKVRYPKNLEIRNPWGEVVKKGSQSWTFSSQKWSNKFFTDFFNLFIFEVPFECLFAPTSRSGMSKFFRDSESFGNCNDRSGLRCEFFCSKMVLNRRYKKSFLLWMFSPFVHSI